jgi:membrane fusion protein (multidrug efflux system)
LSARRVERWLAAIFASDDATGNFTKIVQRVPARVALPADAPCTSLLRAGPSDTVSVDTCAEPSAIACVSQDRVVVGAATETTAPKSATTR